MRPSYPCRSAAHAGDAPFQKPTALELFQLKVYPGSSCFPAKLSQHEPDGGPAKKGKAAAIEALPIFGQAPAAVEPCDRSFDNPAFWKDNEFTRVRALNDFDVDLPADPSQPFLKLFSLVAAVRVEFEQKRKQSEQGAHQQDAAVAVLDIGGMNDGAQQQALRIYKDVALLSLDLFAGVKARRIDEKPPFSALFTLWLSMIAAVGLASRPASSRHLT